MGVTQATRNGPSKRIADQRDPAKDARRIAELHQLNILYTPAEARFDRITRLAQRVFGVPICLVSLVDEKKQWFKSVQGLSVCETDRAVSFCSLAIEQRGGLVINDAKESGHFRDNPLVTGEPHIRFYAGKPLHGPNGAVMGTLCVIDRVPRDFDEDDEVVLRDLAKMVEDELYTTTLSEVQHALCTELELAERRSLLDPMLGVWNRAGIEKVLDREFLISDSQDQPLSIAMIDIDHFKSVNDSYGHDNGDTVLREISARMRFMLRPYDAIGRMGGEEFIIVLKNIDAETALPIIDRLREGIAEKPVRLHDQGIPVTVSIGVSCSNMQACQDVESLVKESDIALYEAKDAGRNCSRIATT